MLYLESPIGVGFSYAKGSFSDIKVNDEMTGNLFCINTINNLTLDLCFFFHLLRQMISSLGRSFESYRLCRKR
jgi:hypothetical protein